MARGGHYSTRLLSDKRPMIEDGGTDKQFDAITSRRNNSTPVANVADNFDTFLFSIESAKHGTNPQFLYVSHKSKNAEIKGYCGLQKR